MTQSLRVKLFFTGQDCYGVCIFQRCPDVLLVLFLEMSFGANSLESGLLLISQWYHDLDPLLRQCPMPSINFINLWRCGSNFRRLISEHMLWIKFMSTFCEIVQKSNEYHDKSALVKTMDWWHQAPSGTKPLPSPMLINIGVDIWRKWARVS